MATRNISLTDMLDQYIEARVRSGAFQNASEVVREGLRLLKKQEDEHAAKLERLRAAIQVGAGQLDRGEGVIVEDLDAWFDEIDSEIDAAE